MSILKERGLKTVGLTIADAHKGLTKAQEKEFPVPLLIKGL